MSINPDIIELAVTHIGTLVEQSAIGSILDSAI